jgi:GTPase SAR1 family protein
MQTLEFASTLKDGSEEHRSSDRNRHLNPLFNFSMPPITNYNEEIHHKHRNCSRLYKLIVIGEIGCGKSALIRQYVHNYFSGESGFNRSTIGVDFSLKILQYNENLEVRLQLWDIAGQERFSSMTRAYYRGTMGALLVFDHSNVKSYEAIKRYVLDRN